ncbi:MAG: hypothetical protein ACREIB_01575 [Pseudomonadota bacterium]
MTAGERAMRLRVLEDAKRDDEIRKVVDAELRRQAEEEARRQAEEETQRAAEQAKAAAEQRANMAAAPADGAAESVVPMPIPAGRPGKAAGKAAPEPVLAQVIRRHRPGMASRKPRKIRPVHVAVQINVARANTAKHANTTGS